MRSAILRKVSLSLGLRLAIFCCFSIALIDLAQFNVDSPKSFFNSAGLNAAFTADGIGIFLFANSLPKDLIAGLNSLSLDQLTPASENATEILDNSVSLYLDRLTSERPSKIISVSSLSPASLRSL